MDMPAERIVLQCVAACCSLLQCVVSFIIILIDGLKVDMPSERHLMTFYLQLSLVQPNRWTSRLSSRNPLLLRISPLCKVTMDGQETATALRKTSCGTCSTVICGKRACIMQTRDELTSCLPRDLNFLS